MILFACETLFFYGATFMNEAVKRPYLYLKMIWQSINPIIWWKKIPCIKNIAHTCLGDGIRKENDVKNFESFK